MNSLIFIVEDNDLINSLLSSLLEKSRISYIFATNIEDAVDLYHRNKEVISYIALDGNLTRFNVKYPETVVLAEIIGKDPTFRGTVFPMSTNVDHNIILTEKLDDKWEMIVSTSVDIKFNTIQEIIKRIVVKRQNA